MQILLLSLDGVACLPKHRNCLRWRNRLITNSTAHGVHVPLPDRDVEINIEFEINKSIADLGIDEWQLVVFQIPNHIRDLFWIEMEFCF